MGKLAKLILVLLFMSNTALGQLRTEKITIEDIPDTTSALASIYFMPSDFSLFLDSVPAVENSNRKKTTNKALIRTGWLLRNVLLHEKYEDYGYIPPITSMADFDTRSVSQYNAVYSKYSIYFN